MTPPTAARPKPTDAPAEKDHPVTPTTPTPNPRLASEATRGLSGESGQEGEDRKIKINWGPTDMSRFVPDTTHELLLTGPDGKPMKLRVVGENKSFIERDQDKKIVSIDYGNVKKLREFGYDGKDLTSVTTTETDKEGKQSKSTLTKDKETGKWFTEVNGTRFFLQGSVEVRENGDFAIQEQPGGAWKTERRDGTSFIERVNASGTRIAFNDDRSVKHVTRTDGATVDCEYKDGKLSSLTETKNGESVTWTKNGEAWQSNQKPPQEKKAISVNDNGVVEYQNADGTKTITRGDGATVNEGKNGCKYEFDAEGRLSKFTYGEGKTREFAYVDGTDQVKSYKEFNPKEPDKARSFERQGTSNDWQCIDSKGQKVAGLWKGEIKTTDEGGWAYKAFEQPGRKVDGMWHKVDSDGVETLNRIGADGSTVTYDTKNNLLSVVRPNGTGVEVTYENGQRTKVSEYNLNTQRETNWSYDAASKTWKSDDKTQTSTECPIGNDGNYRFKSADGSKHTVNTNGITEIVKPDGAKVLVDSDGLVKHIVAKNGDTRTIDYADDGSVAKITDASKTGGAKTWDKNAADAEKRTDLKVSELGDVSFTNAEGKKVIDRTDFSRCQFSSEGKLENVTNRDGSSRTFTYDDKQQLKSVTDTRITNKGPETQVWDNVPSADGSVNLQMKRADGKVETRANVKLDEFGDYSYTGADKKEHFSKTTGRFRDANTPFYSDTISDARASFMETMVSSGMTEGQMTRMERMANEFERRQANLNELRSETFKVRNEGQEARIAENEAKLAAELDQRVQDTYKQLAELASTGDAAGQTYSQKQRIGLVENFMYHAADPTTMNQGDTGTCWIMASHVAGGMVGNTGHMARLLKEVSLTGEYDSLHSSMSDQRPSHFKFSHNLLRIGGGDRGANWTPQSALNSSTRSPVGMIFDQVLPVIGGRAEGHSNSGGYGSRGSGSENIMYMVTGDDLKYGGMSLGRQEKEYVLKNGAWVSSGGGHMWGYMIEKVGNKWQVLKNDQYQGRDYVIAEFDNLRDFIQRDLADRRPGRKVRFATNFDAPGTPNSPVPVSDNTNPRRNYSPSDEPEEYRPRRRFRIFNR